MDEIRIHKVKFLTVMSIAPIILIIGVQIYSGFALPWLPVLYLCILGALGFAIFSILFSQYILVAIRDGAFMWNRSRALGKGKVNIEEAHKAFSPDLLFIVLKDKNRSAVRIPRPFWAQDPDVIHSILIYLER